MERLHQRNFATIHRDSELTLRPVSSHLLDSDTCLVLSSSTIRVPAGPLAGESAATQTML